MVAISSGASSMPSTRWTLLKAKSMLGMTGICAVLSCSITGPTAPCAYFTSSALAMHGVQWQLWIDPTLKTMGRFGMQTELTLLKRNRQQIKISTFQENILRGRCNR